MRDVWKAKDTGEPIVSKHYSSEEKNKLSSIPANITMKQRYRKKKRKDMSEAKSYTATFIPEKNSLLSVDSWTKQMISAGRHRDIKTCCQGLRAGVRSFSRSSKSRSSCQRGRLSGIVGQSSCRDCIYAYR